MTYKHLPEIINSEYIEQIYTYDYHTFTSCQKSNKRNRDTRDAVHSCSGFPRREMEHTVEERCDSGDLRRSLTFF